jgi:hypothetical protein
MSKWAATYARHRWRVHPLKSGSKEPHIQDWPQKASCDPAQITAWWTAYPSANIGLSLDGLACIDVDPGTVGWNRWPHWKRNTDPLTRTPAPALAAMDGIICFDLSKVQSPLGTLKLAWIS